MNEGLHLDTMYLVMNMRAAGIKIPEKVVRSERLFRLWVLKHKEELL